MPNSKNSHFEHLLRICQLHLILGGCKEHFNIQKFGPPAPSRCALFRTHDPLEAPLQMMYVSMSIKHIPSIITFRNLPPQGVLYLEHMVHCGGSIENHLRIYVYKAHTQHSYTR